MREAVRAAKALTGEFSIDPLRAAVNQPAEETPGALADCALCYAVAGVAQVGVPPLSTEVDQRR
jgi:hypothetical protein